MTTIIVNPGSGDVPDATHDHADTNMQQFLTDLKLPGVSYRSMHIEDGGRYSFAVSYGKREYEVEMPGIALEGVRFMDLPGQNIWHYPRLYVDGSSWVWFYAVSVLREMLTEVREDES